MKKIVAITIVLVQSLLKWKCTTTQWRLFYKYLQKW